MRRGDVILARTPSGAASKARPCVIVQHSATLPGTSKITACPLSSDVTPDQPIRVIVAPSAENGLRRSSQVEVDWVFTDHARYFGSVIGALDRDTMRNVDDALRFWVDL